MNRKAAMMTHPPAIRQPDISGGFTLVEILVALTVLAVAAFVLVDAHLTAAKIHLDAAEAAEKRMLLEGVVSRAEVALSAGNLSGEGFFDDTRQDYRWSFQAEPYSADAFTPLFHVQASLIGPDGEDTLEFYWFDPSGGESNTDASLTGKSSVRRGPARATLRSGAGGMSRMGGGGRR
ncbi:MAG TPA: prepilin-type N-terminal cleavage/methylation domain-containing protein [Candidatus Hydrogenedentes bacterium]|nr:prepilin-type N-terminal cleavage/methylation domain-containing protein [Candidatus Hydrogenedentota bacterium]HPU96562.1 prepilin-type N-terminal cleavage/methylation domain-containing protein [Candidatus Hydrogenedentota bacterium]